MFFGDWVPYDARHNYLLEADLGVSFHRDHVETRFAIRTRVLDYIWAGLPMVLTEGDTIAEEAAAAGVARLVRAEDVNGIAQAILEMLDCAQGRERFAHEFIRLREQFAWEKVAQPIIAFCHNPSIAPDKRDDLAFRSLPARPTQPGQGSNNGVLALPGKAWRVWRAGG